MMGTVEARSKDPSGCSSPSPENDKNELREALCALKSGASENGVGFSGHGNQGFGDSDGGSVEVVKSRAFETKVSDETGSVGRKMEDGCQGLADSEMNGVSSLLKMRGSGRNLLFSYRGEIDGVGKLSSDGGSSEVGIERGERDWKRSESEDEDGQNGKTFPNADTNENKDLEMEDLGDEGYGGFSVGDFVWGKIKSHPWWPGRIYDPSDASDFALKLRQKNRLLVAYFGDGTFAWCHPSQLKPFEENFGDMVKQSSSRAFVNAVQEAVNEVGRLLDLKMSSLCVVNKTRSEFTRPLADNSGVKEGILIPENGVEKLSNVLIDPAELLSRVKQIAEIISIANILKLEILKARLSAFYLSRGGHGLPMYEVPQPISGLEDSLRDKTVNVGPSEGAVEAPVHGPFEEDYSTIPMSLKSGELSLSHEISGNRLSHRVKQKSIAEIMGEDKDVNTKNKEGDAAEKVTVRKKRKGSEDTMASKSVQQRKGSFVDIERNVATAENDGGSWGKENSEDGTLAQLKKKKKGFGIGNTSSGNRKETDQEGKAKGKNGKGSLSRERKKSKYLSPPFTIPIREQRKGEIETDPEVSCKDQVSEPVNTASDQLPKSPVPLKLNGDAFQENCLKELAIEQDLPDSSNYQTPEYDENKIIDTTKIQVPLLEVLSEVCYTAISPQTPMNINSLERIVDFIFIYRSSLYHQGSYHKIYKKHKPSKKRKKPDSDLGMLRKDKKSDHISVNNDSEPVKRRRKNETSSGLPKEKQSAAAKTGKKNTDKNASGAALFVSFRPGSSLPSKSDLVTLYSKFGALNESETAIFSSDYTASVFFLKASDAEKALSHSQNMNPFGSSEATFRLQYLYLSAGSRSEKSKSKSSSTKKKDKTPAKPSASLSPGSEASKLNYIKQKLQGLTSMLEASDAKSPDIKTKLESAMKGLLEDVNKMVESSS